MHNDFFTIAIDGKSYPLRPNFGAAVGIESRTGKTLAQAVFAAKSLSLTGLHAILCAAFSANGHVVDDVVVGDAILVDYSTDEMSLIKNILAFSEAFFPKVENDGTKKSKAKSQKTG